MLHSYNASRDEAQGKTEALVGIFYTLSLRGYHRDLT